MHVRKFATAGCHSSHQSLATRTPSPQTTSTGRDHAGDTVELLYDPVLACYYDARTNRFFELGPDGDAPRRGPQ